MHGGGADAEVSSHRAQCLSAQHHCLHHLALAPVQLPQRCHRVVTILGGLPLREAILAEWFEPKLGCVMQAPRL
jgi:hypothetical protein